MQYVQCYIDGIFNKVNVWTTKITWGINRVVFFFDGRILKVVFIWD